MYMGVIPVINESGLYSLSAPHVYGGDPEVPTLGNGGSLCSPCIWG